MKALLRGVAWGAGLIVAFAGIVALYALVNDWLMPTLREILAWMLGLGDFGVVALVVLVVGLALGGMAMFESWWGGGR